MKYAHVCEERKQSVKEHLYNVAQMAESFAVDFMKPLVYQAGLAHDIGKYAQAFQKRLEGSNVKYEHSSCGAAEIGKLTDDKKILDMLYMLQYCIAGHHTGLPDGGTTADSADGDSTLHAKLKRSDLYTGNADYSSYKDEIKLEIPEFAPLIAELFKHRDIVEVIEKYAFFTRYLFSCLTDADYIDTEQFCSPDAKRGLKADFLKSEKALDEVLSRFTADTPLKKARGALQRQAISNSCKNADISILNMPTGSGKTLCSLKLALNKLRLHNKKRIIYVIPYTSIIEQTAEIFEDILGRYAEILQHHSNYTYDECDENTAEKIKRSAENWDAPIIITTSVQFFQSLYHYRSSGLRKLHNMADSIIIFDEVHMLPTELLQPCLRGIGYVTKYLNSEAIFLSATMPDYTPLFSRFLREYSISELITDKDDFEYFRKCRYINLGKTDMENVVQKAEGFSSSLIIVNSRKSAREAYRMISGKKYHLSTYMTPHDRSETISDIRRALAEGEHITVVSTSLVEAGVDLDFEAVFRQLAGLDSILQSGGRCNREGRREIGDVYIFETDEQPHGDIQVRADIVKELLGKGMNIASESCICEYYRRLFVFSDEQIENNSIAKKIRPVTGFDNIPFRTYAEDFEMISNETVGIVIDNCSETSLLLSQLSGGEKNVRRRLQRYTVGLRLHGEFDRAMALGIIRDTGHGVYILSNNDYYSKETGLDISYQPDYIVG